MTHPFSPQRIIYTILCVVSALCFPYWLSLILVLGGCVFFDWYIEGICVFLFADIVFGSPLQRSHHFLLIGSFIAFAVCIIAESGKRLIRYGTS